MKYRWLVLGVVAVAACGDGKTKDPRGYTKAPLEKPGAFITNEHPTKMDELGDPGMPKTEVIPPPADSTPPDKKS